jgi:protein-tyrosine phosphatase
MFFVDMKYSFAGKSRASTFTLAYFIKKMRVPLNEGLDHLRKCRPIAQPNIGFIIQLKAYEA